VPATDARTIAARLGIDETHVRRLQARGYLLSPPLEEWEIRQRLFSAHAAYAAAQPGGADLERCAPVEQRVSLVTLGVVDLARARAFYEGLGWTTRAEPEDDVVFFQSGGMIVALWSRAELAEDSGVGDNGGWGGVTLAHNVRSPAEVDAVIEQARRAGARIAREGAETFWGGYSGVFVDPDGHPWEVAHNPRWTLADDGAVALPG
jgi:predicted lactoylglutathione lyase